MAKAKKTKKRKKQKAAKGHIMTPEVLFALIERLS